MEMHSNANFPCLVNLSYNLYKKKYIYFPLKKRRDAVVVVPRLKTFLCVKLYIMFAYNQCKS